MCCWPPIDHAIARSRAVLAQEAELLELRKRHDSLSDREREVMAGVVAGHLNKRVGAALGISEITVKAHRGKVMRKMAGGIAGRAGDHGDETWPRKCARHTGPASHLRLASYGMTGLTGRASSSPALARAG